ncbi:MAG: hypothetical protein LCH52_09105 [Bacteroidetes bacterium]|nr:hypothetical protein [Bacteroidota bacterium]
MIEAKSTVIKYNIRSFDNLTGVDATLLMAGNPNVVKNGRNVCYDSKINDYPSLKLKKIS